MPLAVEIALLPVVLALMVLAVKFGFDAYDWISERSFFAALLLFLALLSLCGAFMEWLKPAHGKFWAGIIAAVLLAAGAAGDLAIGAHRSRKHPEIDRGHEGG